VIHRVRASARSWIPIALFLALSCNDGDVTQATLGGGGTGTDTMIGASEDAASGESDRSSDTGAATGGWRTRVEQLPLQSPFRSAR